MRIQSVRSTARAMIGAAAMFMLSAAALADTVILKNGQQYDGTIVRETGTEIEIETTVARIKTKLKIARNEIEKIIRGDPAQPKKDAEAPAEPKPEPKKKDAEAEPAADPFAEAPAGKDAAGTPFLVIPIKGTIGEDVVMPGIRRCLDGARARGVKHIVFEIDSPGGLLAETMSIAKLLRDNDRDFSFHALVDREAFSAATIFLAHAKTIHMRPGASTGAATAFHRDRTTGSAEVDAKLNSAWASDLASAADRNGHPSAVFKAMVVQDARLFVWKDGPGFRFHDKEPNKDLKLSATELDNDKTVLSFTAADAIKWGFAKKAEGGPESIAEDLKCEGWRSIGNAGAQTMEQAARARQALVKKIDDLRKNVETNITIAKKADPNEQDIKVYIDSGNFTVESQRRWREACDKSARLWRAIKNDFEMAKKLEKDAVAQGADFLVPIFNDEVDLVKLVEDRLEWLAKNRNKNNIR